MLLLISYKLVIGLKQPDSLEVKRKDPLHQLAISDFSKRIDDSKQVTELYRKLLELPVFPNGPTACPADNGVQYELAFFNRTQLVATATVDALGCQGVTMNKKAFWAMEPKDTDFRVGFASR